MPHHKDLFIGDTLFDKIARTVCQAGTLPRKELYEAWETARRVRRKFRGGRILDLACGHGLLAHIMLILDDSSSMALAVDNRIPENAVKLSERLMQQWPRLKDRIRWVNEPIENIQACPDDIIVSAHACGPLTDQVLDMAIKAGSKVAVLPCCHDTKKCNTYQLEGWMDSSLAIDAGRAFRLHSAGFEVFTQTIPDQITPKNRLLIARPEID